MKKIDITIDYASKEPVYLQIYNYFKLAIETSKLSEASKLPSVRQLAMKLKLNNLTVLKAYNLLESKDYVYKKQGLGVFVKPKEIIVYNNESILMDNFKYGQTKIDKLINFSSGSPGESIYPFSMLREIINEIMEKDGASIMSYHSTQGYEKLREAICNSLVSEGIFFEKDLIQITSGTQQALDLLLKVLITPRNNKIIVGNPTYHGALNKFRANCKMFPVEVLQDGFDMEKLEKILSENRINFIYTMMDFACPTGNSWSNEKRVKLIEMAKKYNTYIVEDDCLSELYYEKNDLISLKKLDIENLHVIYLKSFSKILMPGLRLAYMLLPKVLIEKIIMAKFYSDITSSGLEQRILCDFITKGYLEDHINTARKIYYNRYLLFKRLIKSIPEIEIIYDINGGFFVLIKLDENLNSELFYMKCKEKNLAILPANIFYYEDNFNSYFRLSFAVTDEDEIKEGINRIKIVIEELKNIL